MTPDSTAPLISIVVPSLNQGQYLSDALQSVLQQDGPPVELLVYDGGSSDDSVDVIQRTVGVSGWWSEKDRGHAHAVNKGLKRARGEILGFLNADDVLWPGALRRVADWFQAHPATDLLYGRAHYLDERGRIKGEYLTRGWDWPALHAACFICQPAAFWSRRIFERIGFLDESLHCSLDYDYWLRIGLAGGNVHHLEDFLAGSRDYPTTKTRSRRPQVFADNLRLQRRRLGYVHEQWWFEYLQHARDETTSRRGRWVPSDDRQVRRIARIFSRLSRLYSRRVGFIEPFRG